MQPIAPRKRAAIVHFQKVALIFCGGNLNRRRMAQHPDISSRPIGHFGLPRCMRCIGSEADVRHQIYRRRDAQASAAPATEYPLRIPCVGPAGMDVVEVPSPHGAFKRVGA